VRHLGSPLRDLESTPSLESIRGIEGAAARAYFGVFDHLIVANKEVFYFRQCSRRPPLDLVEELRPVLGDHLALSLVNRRQVQASDFQSLEGGGVWLTEEGRKTVLPTYQKRK
jgi:CRISPR-associated protein Cas1